MDAKMRVQYDSGDTSISKVYPEDDIIWKLEPEKRIRKMLADVQREMAVYPNKVVPDQLVVRG